jgi:putative membrane protein
MPSEHRLHPLSVVFGLGAQVRQLALPALAFLVTAGSGGLGWQRWLAIPVAITMLMAVARYLTFRYRYEADHMVITDGLIFRNERHIPYARIQNIDAVQTVVHRMFGVVEVRIETGGGQKPEATLDVLPLEGLAEMRARVFGATNVSATTSEPDAAAQPLLTLDARELMLFGLIHNRGMIVVGALFGILWEFGLTERFNDSINVPNVARRGVIRSIVRDALGPGAVAFGQAWLFMAGAAAFLSVVRVFSIGWALVRLHRFSLVRAGEDLRITFGLLTRVTATLPLRRIQTVSIRENLLHRYFQRATVRVQTAGGTSGGNDTPQREWLAPLIKTSELPTLLAHILPGVDFAAFDWQPPAPRAFRREMTRWIVISVAVSVAASVLWRWWALVLFPACVAWGAVASRQYVAHLRWATGDGTVVLRRGWLSRETSVARFAKIQSVALQQTPLDRRHAMATVRVDTAGSTLGSSRVIIPYMARVEADRLRAELALSAERTAFEW